LPFSSQDRVKAYRISARIAGEPLETGHTIVEAVIWTDRVKNEDALQGVKKEKDILHSIKRRKANSVGHRLCRKCLLKHVIDGEIKGTRRRGCRHKQLLVDLKETRRCGNGKREQYIALYSEFAVEDAAEVSQVGSRDKSVSACGTFPVLI
jgi:hypothetical protein